MHTHTHTHMHVRVRSESNRKLLLPLKSAKKYGEQTTMRFFMVVTNTVGIITMFFFFTNMTSNVLIMLHLGTSTQMQMPWKNNN